MCPNWRRCLRKPFSAVNDNFKIRKYIKALILLDSIFFCCTWHLTYFLKFCRTTSCSFCGYTAKSWWGVIPKITERSTVWSTSLRFTREKIFLLLMNRSFVFGFLLLESVLCLYSVVLAPCGWTCRHLLQFPTAHGQLKQHGGCLLNG